MDSLAKRGDVRLTARRACRRGGHSDRPHAGKITMSALGTTSMTDPVDEDRSRTKVPRRRRRPIRLSKVLISVAIGLVILFPLFPLYWLVISSLKSTHELLQAPPSWFPAHPTISAFKEAFDAVPFAHSFFNSFLYAGTATISVLVTSMMAGYVFSKYHFRGRNVLFWVIVATMFMPPIVTLVPLYWMISRLGLSDSYLGVVLPWLANAFGVFLMRQFRRPARRAHRHSADRWRERVAHSLASCSAVNATRDRHARGFLLRLLLEQFSLAAHGARDGKQVPRCARALSTALVQHERPV